MEGKRVVNRAIVDESARMRRLRNLVDKDAAHDARTTAKLPLTAILMGMVVGAGVGIFSWAEFQGFYGGWLMMGGHGSYVLYRLVRGSVCFGAVLGGYVAIFVRLFARGGEMHFGAVVSSLGKLAVGVCCAMCVSLTVAHYVGLLSIVHHPISLLKGLTTYQAVSILLLMALIPIFGLVSDYAHGTIFMSHSWRRLAMCIVWCVVVAFGTLGMRSLDDMLLSYLRDRHTHREEEPDTEPVEHRLPCDEPGSIRG